MEVDILSVLNMGRSSWDLTAARHFNAIRSLLRGGSGLPRIKGLDGAGLGRWAFLKLELDEGISDPVGVGPLKSGGKVIHHLRWRSIFLQSDNFM